MMHITLTCTHCAWYTFLCTVYDAQQSKVQNIYYPLYEAHSRKKIAHCKPKSSIQHSLVDLVDLVDLVLSTVHAQERI